MKILLSLVCAVLCVGLAQGQDSQRFAADSSYATNDTTGVAVLRPGNFSAAFHFKDSVNVAIDIQYRYGGSEVWATYAAEPDSTNSTAAGGLFVGYILRSGAANNVPGATHVRAIIKRKTTKNGVTSPTYDAWLVRE